MPHSGKIVQLEKEVVWGIIGKVGRVAGGSARIKKKSPTSNEVGDFAGLSHNLVKSFIERTTRKDIITWKNFNVMTKLTNRTYFTHDFL